MKNHNYYKKTMIYNKSYIQKNKNITALQFYKNLF